MTPVLLAAGEHTGPGSGAALLLALLAMVAVGLLIRRGQDLRAYPLIARPCCNGSGWRTKRIVTLRGLRTVRGRCRSCKGDAWQLRPGAKQSWV